MIGVPALMNIDAYDMLRVDTMLSLCMGYAMLQAVRLWRAEQGGRWELVCFGLSLCALVLIKQIGIGWVVLLTAMLWMLLGRGERRGAVIGWSIGASVLFVLAYAVILVVSIFGSDAESLYSAGFMSALTQRYGQPLPMALLMLTAALLAEGPRPMPPKRQALAAVLVLCFTRWDGMYRAFDPQTYAGETAELAYETELTENFWVDELEDAEPAVILYGTGYPPYVRERLQYVAAPHKVIVSTGEMDEETFRTTLESNGVTHIVCMDEENGVYENAAALSEDGWLDTVTVYTVYREDGDIVIAC